MNREIMNRFAVNPVTLDIPRSKFKMPHSVKFSFNVGDVIPFDFYDVMPGDTLQIDTSKVLRLQPLVAPIMDNVYIDTYWFFCPYRLVWNHWINFMGENTNSAWTPSTEYNIPQLIIPEGGFAEGGLADYFGVPTKVGAGQGINALPFRAYALIMDQWFRDENLMNPVHVTVDDFNLTGVNTGDQVTDVEKGGKPFIACKYFDVFTACLPGPQKGNPVSVKISGTGLGFAPVYARQDDIFIGADIAKRDVLSTRYYQDQQTGQSWQQIPSGVVEGMFANRNNTVGVQESVSAPGQMITPVNLWADLNSIPGSYQSGLGFEINELRYAFAVQRYYEKLARGGSRYIEMIKSFYNVNSPDARLQRTEYLGGSRLPLNVNQVTQTSQVDAQPTPIASVAGQSVTGDNHSDFTKSFTEHGIVIGVCVARYNHTYQQGLDKYFSRKTLFDFYNPTFANIGEQPILKKEIYFSDNADTNNSVFGYNEAWYDYRFKPSRVAGEMRSNAVTPLDMWHLADDYDSVPNLGAAWIREDKSMLDRCLAVTSAVSNQIVADFYIQCEATRPMPMYSIPGLIDHH